MRCCSALITDAAFLNSWPNAVSAVSVARDGVSTRGGSRVGGASVAFEADARTAWRRHRLGQTLSGTCGCGWTQVEGGPVLRVGAGDLARSPPGAKHWHGATATMCMTNIAIVEAQDGRSVEWLEPVADEAYAAVGRPR